MYTIIEKTPGGIINHGENAAVLFSSKAAAKRYARKLNNFYGVNSYTYRRLGKC